MSLLSILRIYFLTGTGVFITFLLIFEIEIQAVVTFLINVSSVMRSRKNSQENIFHGIFSIKLQNLGLWKNTLMPNVLINDLATTPYSVTAGLILERTCVRTEGCNFIEKEALVQVFSCEFCEISKSTFFHRTPLDDCFWLLLFWISVCIFKEFRKTGKITCNYVHSSILFLWINHTSFVSKWAEYCYGWSIFLNISIFLKNQSDL